MAVFLNLFIYTGSLYLGHISNKAGDATGPLTAKAWHIGMVYILQQQDAHMLSESEEQGNAGTAH